MPDQDTMEGKRINAHAHCFTIKHVPEHFFDALTFDKHILSIQKMGSSGVYRTLVQLISSAPLRAFFGIFSKDAKKQLKRLHGLISFGMMNGQAALIDKLSSFYNDDFRLMLLSMDLECMMTDKDDDQLDPPGRFFDTDRAASHY